VEADHLGRGPCAQHGSPVARCLQSLLRMAGTGTTTEASSALIEQRTWEPGGASAVNLRAVCEDTSRWTQGFKAALLLLQVRTCVTHEKLENDPLPLL